VQSAQALVFQLVASGDPVGFQVRCDLSPPDRRRLSLAVPSLDTFLGGGFPCGAITEVFGGRSSGKTTLAQALIATTVRSGAFAAWIDLPNAFRPERPSDHVLWVAPRDCVTALRAAEHVLEAGGFRVLILDLGAPTSSRSVVPVSRWLRLTRLAERRDAVILVLSAVHAAGAFAALSLEACAQHRRFGGSSGPCPVFEGVESSLYLHRSKHEPLMGSSIGLRAVAED
jgi:hypothetical protein